MLTDSRFIIGVAVGAALVYFGLPLLKGTLAAKRQG